MISQSNRVHVFRLRRGQDLFDAIIEYTQEKNISCGVILSAVGCVSRVKLRDASGVNTKEILQHLEIVSITGTVSANRTHLHVSFSNEDLNVFGGHLVSGCIINTTAEIVIMELCDLIMEKEYDTQTGYHELYITKKLL